MEDLTLNNLFTSVLIKQKPAATAWIRGNRTHPRLNGIANFYRLNSNGILISVEVYGLPQNKRNNFFGMHIHEFGDCTLPFDKTGNHYNPANMPHPNHAGDLPPIIGNNGYAWMAFYDNRFTIHEVIGKSIVIHDMRDDFTSQPSGDSGMKMACGVIKKA